MKETFLSNSSLVQRDPILYVSQNWLTMFKNIKLRFYNAVLILCTNIEAKTHAKIKYLNKTNSFGGFDDCFSVASQKSCLLKS